MNYNTPLRYPGGKAKLGPFVRSIFQANSLMDGHYVEPYAGGAGVAFDLLFREFAAHIHLNDLDRAVYCFWHSVLNETEALCRMIRDTRITIDQWHIQREIYRNKAVAEPIRLGFATFFLNRTNRSGILNGGVIGGLEQKGNYKIDARFNKTDLIARIEKIARYRNRISIYNLDAVCLIETVVPTLPEKVLVYLDPPYFVKGSRLYQNHYKVRDHQQIANTIQTNSKQKWLVSYDNVPEIVDLYSQRRRATYNLSYSAADRRLGTEVMFFSDNLVLPDLPEGMDIFLPKQPARRLAVSLRQAIKRQVVSR